MKSKKIVVAVIVLIVIITSIDISTRSKEPSPLEGESTISNEGVKISDEDKSVENDPFSGILDYPLGAELLDVTEGYELSGVQTNGNASGSVQITKNESFELNAIFKNLPKIDETVFYEGWLVRIDPLDFFSTGKAVLKDGIYSNNYTTDKDLSDYDHYVLTIEFNDDNTGPGQNILEGTLRSN